MRTILISLMLVMFTRIVYGDAVIFSGNDVKALKQNLDLFGTSKLMGTNSNPSSGGGLAAPLGSIAMNYVTGIGYIKTSAPNTGWSRIVDTAYAPGVYFSQGGNAFGAAGVLGTTDANRLDFITGGVVGMSLATTGAVTVTSADANALAVGPNGTTNPALQVDTSTASAVTGIKITSAAAAGGAKIEATSSAGSEDLVLGAKGDGGTVKLQVNLLNRYIASLQGHTFSSGTGSSASSPRFSFTGSADTALTASTEAPSTYFNLGQTRQHATGTMSLQRDFRITPSTHSFVGASTLSNAAAFSIDGPSNGSTNATITNSHALYIPTSALTNVTNSYGLSVNATSGATNNYAAQFMGGNVGIGTSAPSEKLHVAYGEIMVSSNTTTSNDVYKGIKFTTDNEPYYSAVRANRDAFSSRIGLSFFTANGAAPAEKMRINYAGNVGIGISAPTNKLHQDSGNATASYHQFTAGTTTGQTSTDGTLVGIDASGNAIFNNQEAAYVNFLTSNTQRARITALGSLVVGNNSSALATNATDGFLYVSSSAGAPTGTPTTQTGSVPIHVDATNNALYMYTNGAWRGANNSAVQGSRQTGTSMSAGTAITPALGVKTVAFVVGNGGAVTITASPPIVTTGMIVGQELKICGTDNTNTVTYTNSVNLVLTGSATLGKDQCLDLMFAGTDGANLSWIETGRSF